MPPSTLRPDAIVAVIRTRSAAAGSTQASYSKSYSKLFGRVNVGSGVAAKALRHQLLHLDAGVVPGQNSAVRNEAQKRLLGVVGLSRRRQAGRRRAKRRVLVVDGSLNPGHGRGILDDLDTSG